MLTVPVFGRPVFSSDVIILFENLDKGRDISLDVSQQ